MQRLIDDCKDTILCPGMSRGVVVLAEIYAARERNTIGISSQDLVEEIPGSVYCPTLPEVTQQLRQLAQPGDVILTVGAGDIYRAGEALVNG